METNMQHEDLMIKLHAKLNEEKIKLWEPPYVSKDEGISESLQELAEKYAISLSLDKEVVLNGLFELQKHSIQNFKALQEFKETGFATLRIKISQSGQKPIMLNTQKKLDVMGNDLIDTVANEMKVPAARVKLIYNGKVIKPTQTLQDQSLKNGVQMMALIMADSQEQLVKEDKHYKEMKSTLEDATLLSENVDFADDEYMGLEDQSGAAVQLPAAERRALQVALALHARGRAAAHAHDHALALVLFLEADRLLGECSSSLLNSVDNWAVLQLDISWCYLCLRALPAAPDAAARLRRAEAAFAASYGASHERLIALKGTAANERVLLMRLYLLQGIVAYHQNRRDEARRLLDRAEQELATLKVDSAAVSALLELGWSAAQARRGLRAAAGDLDAAHHYLAERRRQRDEAREKHRLERQRRLLGTCADGTAVSGALVEALTGMGYTRSLAIRALRNANNNVADAVRIIQEQPEMLIDSDEEPDTPSSEHLPADIDNKLLTELEAMGYCSEDAAAALRFARNRLDAAVELLVAATDHLQLPSSEGGGPSTSRDDAHKKLKKYMKKQLAKRREREAALQRLSAAIGADDDDHLDADLTEEEAFLAQYKSLL